MSENHRVRVAVIGCGSMARGHVHSMLRQQDSTEIAVLCDPSGEAIAQMNAQFAALGLPPPPNEPDMDKLLHDYQGLLDAAFIVTPHAYHCPQAKACLEAGLDVLIEKPMVITATEAQELIDTRNRTGKLLVVAFNGSLSHQIRTASRMLSSGEVGRILNIAALVWEDWAECYRGHWKQMPEISGGGFMFDTGAHMLNTVSDLAGEDFVEVAAWLDNQGRPIDILGCVMGRLASGALVTMNACGSAIPSCSSEIRIFCTQAILRTGIWGERLDIQFAGEKELHPVSVAPSHGSWEQFLAVRRGEIANPCPPEIGLRMARLWDAIKESAAQHGVPVRLTP
jgi:predicted dehydrogenase